MLALTLDASTLTKISREGLAESKIKTKVNLQVGKLRLEEMVLINPNLTGFPLFTVNDIHMPNIAKDMNNSNMGFFQKNDNNWEHDQ